MIKNVLSAIGGVEMYGIISVCLFFTVFLAAMEEWDKSHAAQAATAVHNSLEANPWGGSGLDTAGSAVAGSTGR